MNNAMILSDFYKTDHRRQYPPDTRNVYSNWTPRGSRIPGIEHVVTFGIQYVIQRWIIEEFNDNFFARDADVVVPEYQELLAECGLEVPMAHVYELHALGYMPLEIKALDEGTLCPMRVPMMTIVNTNARFGWLTNFLETLLSAELWGPMTSATIAWSYRRLLDSWAEKTGGTGVSYQGHDFSMRGMRGIAAAAASGAGHLLSFNGTDTIPAITWLKRYYGATGYIGGSVPATEHSVMCLGGDEDELGTFRRLIIDVYPAGILSIVSDTWNLWTVLTEYMPALKDEIMARDGKVVIRPDSGDPVDIICGNGSETKPEGLGVVQLLWDAFGGTVNSKGYKVLDPHVGCIYGDAITWDRANEICSKLEAAGFCSTNIVFGIGSFTYQYNTRDTFGFAMKATAGIVGDEMIEIYKDPVTDSGLKRSSKGLLRVDDINGELVLSDQCSVAEASGGLLKTVFKDGSMICKQTLKQIKIKLWS